MSHRMTKKDRQVGIIMAWHSLTELAKKIYLRAFTDAEGNQQRSPLDFDPVRVPLMLPDGTPYEVVGDDGKTHGIYGLVASDDMQPIGEKPVAIHDSYGLITNSQIIDQLESAMEGTDHNIVSIGTCRNRGRFYVTYQIDDLPSFQAANREIKQYFTMSSSHDESTQLRFNSSNIAVVCDNTFGFNLAEGGIIGALKHSKHAIARLPDMGEAIEACLGVQATFKTALDSFASVALVEDDARALFAGFLTRGNGKTELPTRTQNTVDRLVTLYRSGRGNAGATLADGFSALTDYYSHESSLRKDDPAAQVESSEFGAGARAKSDAFALLSADMGASLITAGRKVIGATTFAAN